MISSSYALDLIDNHKRIHGDTPFPRVPPAGAQRSSRGPSTVLGPSYGSRGRSDPPQSHGSWKRKYSLRHRSPQSFAAHPFTPTSCNHTDASVKATSASSGGGPLSPRLVTRMTTATVTSNVSRKAESFVPQREHGESRIYGTQQTPGSRPASPPGTALPSTRHSLPPLVGKAQGKGAVATAAPALLTTTAPPVAALPKLAKQPSSHSGHGPTRKSASTSSKFVWVKTQDVEGLERSRVCAPPKDSPPSKAAADGCVASTWKKAPGKKPARRLTQATASPKTSKYKWVSTYAQSKISRKSISSKLPLPQRALETDDTLKKAKTALTSPAKAKKEVATSSRSSHYSWKAVPAAGTALPRRASFYWTPEKRRVREGFSSGTLRTTLPGPPPSCPPGPFKLRSQMKIIRRSANRSVNGTKSEVVIVDKNMELLTRGCTEAHPAALLWVLYPAGFFRVVLPATTRRQHPFPPYFSSHLFLLFVVPWLQRFREGEQHPRGEAEHAGPTTCLHPVPHRSEENLPQRARVLWSTQVTKTLHLCHKAK